MKWPSYIELSTLSCMKRRAYWCGFFPEVRKSLANACQYSQWTRRRDKRGIPVCILDLSHLNPATVAAHKTSSNTAAKPSMQPESPAVSSLHVRRAYAIHDHLTRFAMPFCSAVADRPNPKTPITKHIILADITNMGGIIRGWKMRDFVLEFDKLLNRNYPEILDQVFVSLNNVAKTSSMDPTANFNQCRF
jgi:hypothetical protein